MDHLPRALCTDPQKLFFAQTLVGPHYKRPRTKNLNNDIAMSLLKPEAQQSPRARSKPEGGGGARTHIGTPETQRVLQTLAAPAPNPRVDPAEALALQHLGKSSSIELVF